MCVFLIYHNNFVSTTSVIQMILTVVISVALVAMVGVIFRLYRHVLVPIRKFSDNINRFKAGKENFSEITKSEIYELEQANHEFREMMEKIHLLEDEVYKAQIEKQFIHLDYLKLQIKPHFYINCLNFIYNMIDLGKEDEAREMIVMTAEFFRNLLGDNVDFVMIKEEIELVRYYMRIQKLRFQDKVEFDIVCEEGLEEKKIPPLMIESFVENCMKYAVGHEPVCKIMVTIFSEDHEGELYINLCITDNGPGFEEERLEILNQPHSYKSRAGIGTYSAMKRLKYLYDGQASIRFYNLSRTKGAVVDIHFPA